MTTNSTAAEDRLAGSFIGIEVDRGVTSVWEPELFPAEIRAVFRSLRQLNPIRGRQRRSLDPNFIGGRKMSEEIKYDRRHFLGTAAMTIAAAQLGMIGSADAQPSKTKRQQCPRLSQGRTRRSAR